MSEPSSVGKVVQSSKNLIASRGFTIFATSVVGIIAALALLRWIGGDPSAVSENANDFLERALDANIMHNAQDFVRWYRSNIVIQLMIILSSLLATIYASITTKDNADTLKRYTVLLTALTS